MADLMPGIPSVPGDETTWANFVDQFETLKKGDIPLSLTNWDASTTIPAIAAGSAIEVAGGVYRYPAEQSIITPTATGTNYLMVSADNGACECTATPPIWRDDLNGWYYANALYRYTGHVMDWDGANAYTNKRVFTVDGPGGEVVTVGAGGNLTAGAITSGDVDCGAITSGDVDCGDLTAGRVACDSVYTDNVNLRVKTISSDRASVDAGVAHGLAYEKIKAINSAAYRSDTDTWYMVGQGYGTPQSGDAYTRWGPTNVYINNLNTGHSSIRILIFYEA